MASPKPTTAPLTNRLPVNILKTLLATLAMYLFPTLIQYLVLSLDTLYELLGRRARSPYEPISLTSIAVGMLVLVAWHVWLGRLGYRSVGGGSKGRGKAIGREVWPRVLGRIVVPGLLVVLGGGFVAAVVGRVMWPVGEVVSGRGGEE